MSSRLVAGLVALAALAPGVARGEDVTVGLYAPTAPFGGPVDRLEYASSLAAHLGQKLGKNGVGRAYAKASDFAAAVKRGDVQFALVEGAYAAGASGMTVLGVAQRGGSGSATWEVMTTAGATSVWALKGKTAAMPAVGGREEAFLENLLFAGEIDKAHFGALTTTPDALSAVAALEAGKVDAAIVPGGLTLPSGARVVATIPGVSWPLLVALPGASAADVDAVRDALSGFAGDAVFPSIAGAGGDTARHIAARLAKPSRRGPMAVSTLRLAAGSLLEGRTFTLPLTPAKDYAKAP